MITPIVGFITKDSASTDTGILFYQDGGNTHILDIDATSPFASTDLRPGMIVISVNNIPCEGAADGYVSSIVLETVGTLTILAHHDSATMAPLKNATTITPMVASATAVLSPQPSAPPMEPDIHVNAVAVPILQATLVPENNTQIPVHVPAVPAEEHHQSWSQNPVSPPPSDAQDATSPPPGVAGGGVWGKVKVIGGGTVLIAAICCALFFLPGLLAFCCPVDEKRAYSVAGKIYDKNGRYIGSTRSMTFIPNR